MFSFEDKTPASCHAQKSTPSSSSVGDHHDQTSGSGADFPKWRNFDTVVKMRPARLDVPHDLEVRIAMGNRTGDKVKGSLGRSAILEIAVKQPRR